ncbi:hypothetical protein BaRGS_00003216 [Batillaria attramentaria]|uniref:Crossover junction endonuclease MUS81 n=1 Tax=Batillaria attramentaria TaxID=370345 RepID=A0ABD0M2E3_9CAEN
MSSTTASRSLLGKRKKKRDPCPNPLFCKWLAEWRDEAKEKGWKSEFIYSKALRSLKKYPLLLSSGKECKMLQNFGDKICKMLDDRLLLYKTEQHDSAPFPESDDSQSLPSVPTAPLESKSVAAVHEISDSSDDDVDMRTRTASHSAPKYSRVDFKNPSTVHTEYQRTAVLGTVDISDEEISIIEEKSFLKSENGFYGFTTGNNLSDPPLPNLSNGSGDEKGKGNVQNGKKRSARNKSGGSCPRESATSATAAVGAARVHVQVAGDGGGGGSDDDDEAGQVAPPQRARAGARQKEYVPAYRSGPYAILLTLYRHAQDPDFRGFMTKAELCRNAQPLADKSFTMPDPGRRYTAWSSVSILIKKGFLTKESSPAKYRLTEAGLELAHRLEEVERRQAAGADGGVRDGVVAAAPQAGCRADETQGQGRPLDDDLYMTDAAQDHLAGENSPKGKGAVTSAEILDHNWFVAGDSDDDLPALPSLAERLKPSAIVNQSVENRPLGDDYVFAYMMDLDCDEEAPTPAPVSCPDPGSKPGNNTRPPKSAPAAKRPVHDMSDSDSEPDSLSSINSLPKRSAPPSKALKCPAQHFPRPARDDATHQSSSTSSEGPLLPNCSIPRVPSSSGPLTRVPSMSGSQDSIDSVSSVASSLTAGEVVPEFVLYPGTFDVVLKSSSKTLLPDLIKNGVNCDLRVLNVGDLLWVARERTQPSVFPGQQNQQESMRRELVLNYVVERKRMDDLVSSMIGGRMKEQKFRLKHCGLQEKIILIESYGSMQHFSISEDRIRQAITNTEIIDGFTVKQTRDSKETAAYLTLMTRYLQSYYQNKTLRSCSRDRLKQMGLTFQLDDTEQMLMPFDHFNQASMKSKPLTVRELFGKQLIQLWGMSADKAKAVVDRFPTPSSLLQAYSVCSTDKERDSLLANVKYGKNLRNLGIAVSRQVAQLYNAKKLE